MPKVITAFVWNKTADVGVPPQREHVVYKSKKGKDIVTLHDDECLVIWQGKIKRSRYLTEEQRWEGYLEEQIPEYWVFIRDLKFIEKDN